MSRSDYGKERIALFTRYFIEDGKPITVKGLIKMFEDYSGVPIRRQTVYNDLNAIDVVIPLERTRNTKTPEYLWSRAKGVLK